MIEIERDFPEFERLVLVGDKLTTKSKNGALIGLCGGHFYMLNDSHSVGVILKSQEADPGKDYAFRSNFVPNMSAPIEISATEKDIVFEWHDGKTARKHKIPREKGKWKELEKAFEDFDVSGNVPSVPKEALNSISDDVSVLEILQEEDGMIFKQIALTGNEDMEAKVDLASQTSGLGGFFEEGEGRELDEISVKLNTKDFKIVPLLTDEDFFALRLRGDDLPVDMGLKVGSINAQAIIGCKIYEV